MSGSEFESKLLRLLAESRSEADLVCDIAELVRKETGANQIQIYSGDRRAVRLERWSRSQDEQTSAEKDPGLHRQDPLVALAERVSHPLSAEEWQKLPAPEGRPSSISRARAILPLKAGIRLSGLLVVEGGQGVPRGLDRFEKAWEAVGQIVGRLLEGIRLRGLAVEDPATGLKSYDYFSIRLGDEIERAHRHDRKVSLVLLRLQGLSEQLKHLQPPVADRILGQIGTILRENNRRTSLITRMAMEPDVFAILLPELGLEPAGKMGQLLCDHFATAEFEGLQRTPAVFWGMATFPDNAASRQLLSSRAFADLNRQGTAVEARKPSGRGGKGLPDFIAEMDIRNPEIVGVFETAFRIADSKSTVLIQGETGVGKEVLAEFVHRHSARKQKTLVKVNCGALPESLVESELFGHEKGSFTGAEARRVGRFELAHEGTIFLDEVGELTLNAQVKLLRIIEGKAFYRLGGTTPVTTDVRIVAATNRDLATEVAAGRFREDLYYRLNVISFTIPPLRRRREDIPLLVAKFMKGFNEENKTTIQVIHPETMDIFYRYDWPGNVRELRNAIERAMILAGPDGKIIPRYLPPSVLKGATGDAAGMPDLRAEGGNPGGGTANLPRGDALRFPDLNERQRQIIEFLRVNPNVSNQQYVTMMNVSRRTCVRDLNELIDRNLVVRDGKKKSCVYRLADGV